MIWSGDECGALFGMILIQRLGFDESGISIVAKIFKLLFIGFIRNFVDHLPASHISRLVRSRPHVARIRGSPCHLALGFCVGLSVESFGAGLSLH